MTFPIIDTHTHTYFSHFDSVREKIIQKARDVGVVSQIQIGCDEISSLAAVELAKANEGFYATIGIHPCDVAPFFEGDFHDHRIQGFENHQRKCKTVGEFFEYFEDVYQKNSDIIVGVGETGFDRYHDTRDILAEWQDKSFLHHLKFAEKYDLPIIIHTRSSTKELLEFMDKNMTGKKFRGVVHCFCEDLQTARIITEKYGFYLGIGGIVTYSGAQGLRDAIAKLPLKSILSETDSPFLPPIKYKKKHAKNTSAALPEIIETIAKVKNIDTAEAGHILYENAKNLFQIEPQKDS